MRRGSIAVLLASLLVSGCGGGDDSGSADLANGKVFDQAELRDCFRDQGFRVDPRQTETGIDLAVQWRSGQNNADVAVEPDPAAAESREEEWKQLADDAGIENAESFYFRYGNVLIGYEKVPGEQDRARIERCLS